MYNYKDFKNYLIIFILSLIFGLYLFEMYLNFKSVYRGSDIEKNRAILKKEKNLEYDVRSKHEIYKSMKLNDKNITVSVSPRVFNDPDKKLHFLSGISKSKTINLDKCAYWKLYDKTNIHEDGDQLKAVTGICLVLGVFSFIGLYSSLLS